MWAGDSGTIAEIEVASPSVGGRKVYALEIESAVDSLRRSSARAIRA
ncbi:hypothetical protein OG453_25225 [Streptomyces sp. NBC_01381]|nr:hypothetical protein [Streptomyces sp. NBC_01381]MCX4669950.1 hypothetical protein [Streptomyces sp. NBC_01381]